ncbi:MAG: hypothetical protein JXR97_09260 [Planctomycetes bacterium]|nr:hypothetical protein [Planctomycetota bacterium]
MRMTLSILSVFLLYSCCLVGAEVRKLEPGEKAELKVKPVDFEKKDESPSGKKPEPDKARKKYEPKEFIPTQRQLRIWMRELIDPEELFRSRAKTFLVLGRDHTVAFLTNGFSYYYEERRLAAINVLSLINNDKSAYLLAGIAMDDDERSVRVAAAKALAKQRKDEYGRNRIMLRAFHPDDDEKDKAMRALANAGEKDYVDKLLDCTEFYIGDLAVTSRRYVYHGSRIGEIVRTFLRSDGSAVDLVVPAALPEIRRSKKADALYAIKKISREDFGTDIEKWRGWWEENRAGFEFPDLDQEEK